MSKTIPTAVKTATNWKKNLGGSLNIYSRDRSKYIWLSFYVSPHYSKNGLHRQSLKPITNQREATTAAREIFKKFPFERYASNPRSTTFNDVALKAFEHRKKKYQFKEHKKKTHDPKFVSTAIKEWNRYEKEIKPFFGMMNINDKDTLQGMLYDFVDKLTTVGNKDGRLLDHNTIAKYLNIIGLVQHQAISMGVLSSMCDNPPLERRKNPRPAYRMLELKKITDEIMNEYKKTQDLFFLEMHDYIQFCIASPTRYGSETLNLRKFETKILQSKNGYNVLHVFADQTKRGSHSYEVSPEFLRLYGNRILDKFGSLENDDYFWFSNFIDASRPQIQQRVRKNFVRISKSLGLYLFNGSKRPITSIRHMGYQRMKKEGVSDVAQIYNTSDDMGNQHYLAESDDLSILERHDRIYAKRIKK